MSLKFKRVMHLWNTAGIGGLIARYMDRMLGTQSQAYMWDKWDPFGQATEKTVVYSTILGKLKVPTLVRTARHFDIIHNHGLDSLTPWLKLLYPDKKLILHYHGTRIRGKWARKRKFWRWADHLLVSTPDLLDGAPVGTMYVPNLVDWDIIEELRKVTTLRYGALTVSRWADHEAHEIARAHGLKLTVHDRLVHPLDHRSFLINMNKFSYYIDIKRDFGKDGGILHAHSLTGLEAKALGLTVLNWWGEVAEIDIEKHRPENVIPILYEIYLRDS